MLRRGCARPSSSEFAPDRAFSCDGLGDVREGFHPHSTGSQIEDDGPEILSAIRRLQGIARLFAQNASLENRAASEGL